MNLIYINNSRSTVFDSQVLALLQYFVSKDWFKKVILVYGYQNEDEIKWLEGKDTEGILIFYYKSFPNYPFFNFLIRRNLYNTIRKMPVDFDDCFYHIRGEMMSFHFKRIMSKINIASNQLLTDLRGVSIQELKEYSNSGSFKKELKLFNYKRAYQSIIKDSNISVVSDFFEKHLRSDLAFNESTSISVNPCLVNKNFKFNKEIRKKIRDELKLKENEILLIFTSGGSANWQNNDVIIQLAEKGIKVLNLSKKEVKYKNVINLFVSYDKVPSYLCAADIAFIWRDNSLVNKVASPVKVSEYLACGLPIIHNGTVHLINQMTTQGEDAIIINEIESLSLELINNVVSKVDREKLSQRGLTIFGVSQIADSYKKIYYGEVKNIA